MVIEEGVPIKSMYGYIQEVWQTDQDEDEYYIVRVSREGGIGVVDTNLPVIPLEQTVEELSSLYGPPSALIGRRVRVIYTGRDFTDGVH